MRYFIPIGADCKPARILKAKGLRVFAFPFDCLIIFGCFIIILIENNYLNVFYIIKSITIYYQNYKLYIYILT